MRAVYPSSFTARIVVLAAMLVVVCAWSSNSHAARPLVTDDARLVDPRACQVESWINSNDAATQLWVVPACNLADNVEVSVGVALERIGHEVQASTVQAQVKRLIKPLTANAWGVGYAFGLAREPSASATNPYFNLPLSVSWLDDAVVLHVNAGALRDASAHRIDATWGVGGEFQLTSRSWLLAETFGRDHDGTYVQVGLRSWLVTNRLQLDATLGDRVRPTASDRWISIGIRWLSASFLP